MPNVALNLASAADQSIGGAVGVSSRYEISNSSNSQLSPEGDIELHQSKALWSLDLHFDLGTAEKKRTCLGDNRSDPRALDRCGRISYYDAVVRAKSGERNQEQFFTGSMKLPLFRSATPRTILPFAWQRFFSPLPEVNPVMGVVVEKSGLRVGIAATNDVTTAQGGEFSASHMQPLAVLSLEVDVAAKQVVRWDFCSYDLNHSRLVRGEWDFNDLPGLNWKTTVIFDERRRRLANQTYKQTIESILFSTAMSVARIEWQFDGSITKFAAGEAAGGHQSEYQLGAAVPFVAPGLEHARFSVQFGSFVALDHFTPSEATCSSGGCGRGNYVRGMWTFKI